MTTTLSTHVLDTALGRPAAGLRVTLSSADGRTLGEGVTDDDGRIGTLGEGLEPGEHHLRFETGPYFLARAVDHFYPSVSVAFTVGDDAHLHVPLLLSPFGFSTYRGS